MPIEIRILRPGDDSLLINAAPGVFDNPVTPEGAREFLLDPRHHIVAAIDDGVLVGFASGVHYINPDKPPELWINEVSLAPTHRGRGLGKSILKALLEAGRLQKCTMAWVLTHRTNPAAIALYASVGGVEGVDNSGPIDSLTGFSFPLT